jgi:isopentenyl diphosphate isomerase/L-lactate dehydrogenase-like FMN-dependent dehydrogenase
MAAVESDSSTTVPICIADLETYAKSKLDEGTWNYYYNGAADEITRRENVEAFNR